MMVLFQIRGQVALVTGATRGVGKGIAVQLGEAGAIVYITGRTLEKSKSGPVGGSLQETAEEIASRGGKCIPVKCDHTNDHDVFELFERIKSEQNGRLDILVNNVFGGVKSIAEHIGKPFWDAPVSLWDDLNNAGLRSHYVCSHQAAKLMVQRRRGLIVNISSFGGIAYMFPPAYGIGKCAIDRMSSDFAIELRPFNVACVTLYPGLVNTEYKLHYDSVNFYDVPQAMQANSESPEYSGRCVVHMAQDPDIFRKSGTIQMSCDIGSEYGFSDVNGKFIRNVRSASLLLASIGWHRLAALLPDWIIIPKWITWQWHSRFSPPVDPPYVVRRAINMFPLR